MLGAQCTSHRRHNRSQMKNKIYHYGSFSRNFYLSVVKVKVPHPGIKLQMPHTYGRLFKRLCCSFSLMTMGEMLMELFMILLSCLERNLSPPPPSPCIPSSYFWNEAKLVYRALDDHFIKVTTMEELSWLRRPKGCRCMNRYMISLHSFLQLFCVASYRRFNCITVFIVCMRDQTKPVGEINQVNKILGLLCAAH